MIRGRCSADGADLVSLKWSSTLKDGVSYQFCPMCSTAILGLGPEGRSQLRLRYRYRKGDLFLMDLDDARAHAHLAPLREAVDQFLKVGLPFTSACYFDSSRAPVVAEAERIKLVWCSSCKKGTAYVARPRYGWTPAGVYRHDDGLARHVVVDYFGPADLESLVEAAVAELKPLA